MKESLPNLYTKKNIADLFGRPEHFVKTLFTMGLPHSYLSGHAVVSKKAFWEWIGYEEPDLKNGSPFITLRTLAKETDMSKSAAYRMKDRLPDSVLLRFGNQFFVIKDRFYDWLLEESKQNPGGRL